MLLKSYRMVSLCIASFLIAMPALAQDGKSDGKSNGKSKDKPYDEVITEDAVTDAGLFTVHTIGEKLFYEITPDQFGDDLVWVTQIAKTQAGHSYAGMPIGDRVVRWERRGDKVLLRDVDYSIRADVDDPIRIAVEATSVSPIIKVFPIKAHGKDKSVVIEVTDLFTKDVPEFSAKGELGAKSMDSGRSFIEQVKSFPENIETKVLGTYTLAANANRPSQSAVTAVIHHSMVKLPDDPMEPRILDRRVGFFSVGFTDFADDSKNEAGKVRYITRWRLEKKDPDAELSEPVKPIVWYVGRAVPEKWKPYVKEGIEAWEPIFRSAGFKNAIVAKYAPDATEDPDWDAEDARISTIRWLPAEIANAFGPHISDPRTGEILEADVRMYHNVMQLVRDWYFVQASPNDARARQLPLPDDVMGELIRAVVAHEVGHSLGLPHNMKASSAYTVAQLRDPEWTKENGTAPSIMDYARFNYVAQPGDNAALMMRTGPYDHFIVEWGYRQYADAEAQETAHRAMYESQITNPMFRYGGGSSVDPTAQTEDLTGDGVAATTLGMKNLERVASYLIEATCKEGQDYSLLQNGYDALFSQWNREMGHVVTIVGGVEQTNLYFGDADQRFFPISSDRQREAAKFLIENALATPEMFIDRDVIARLTASGVADKVLSAQSRVLRSLLRSSRIDRMTDAVESEGDDAYAPSQLLDDITEGLFQKPGEPVDIYQRNIQRTYIATLTASLTDASATSDFSGLARAQLTSILKSLGKGGSPDAATSAHLNELRARISEALDID